MPPVLPLTVLGVCLHKTDLPPRGRDTECSALPYPISRTGTGLESDYLTTLYSYDDCQRRPISSVTLSLYMRPGPQETP